MVTGNVFFFPFFCNSFSLRIYFIKDAQRSKEKTYNENLTMNRKATYSYSQQFLLYLLQFILFRCSRIQSCGVATFDAIYLNRWL